MRRDIYKTCGPKAHATVSGMGRSIHGPDPPGNVTIGIDEVVLARMPGAYTYACLAASVRRYADF
ncbi:MAG: hypothetical protein VB140_10590 [Burkholderia sp.]